MCAELRMFGICPTTRAEQQSDKSITTALSHFHGNELVVSSVQGLCRDRCMCLLAMKPTYSSRRIRVSLRDLLDSSKPIM